MTQTVRNILKIYRQAKPEEIAGGLDWYANAQREAKAMAKAHNVPLRIAVGVMAALSPNNKWERNVANTNEMLRVFFTGGDVTECKPSTYKAMRNKAWAILEAMPESEAEIVSILNGQKIVSFFDNIMGHDTCTIDGHALNIARGKREGLTSDKTNVGRKEYKKLQEDYARAAKRVDLKAYELQAITWVAWKRIHNI